MNEAALQSFDDDGHVGTSAEFSRVLGWSPKVRDADRTGADILEASTLLAKRDGGTAYPLWTALIDNRPLSVIVRFENNIWFAELDFLNVFGEGTTPGEAIQELEAHIDHFIEYYGQHEVGDLTAYAVELKRRFAAVQRANL